MARLFLGLLAGAGLAAASWAPVAAQSVPSGSYQQSCTHIRVRGDELTARCTSTGGTSVRSSIALGACPGGDIANRNGQLTCNAGNGYGNGNGNGYGRWHRNHGRYNNGGYNNGGYNNGGYNNGRYSNGAKAPGGSYQSSCTNVQMNGSALTATCTAPNGSNLTSTIDATRCGGRDIANINGRLGCR